MNSKLELMGKTLNQKAQIVHNLAKDNGFYEKESNIAEKLMLIVSELGEACEAHRKNKRADIEKYKWEINSMQVAGDKLDDEMAFKMYIKDTIEDELADAIIRILDLCAYLNINIDWHVAAKHDFNSTREYKHGKAY